MTGKLERPTCIDTDDYRDHCRNIANIISKTEALHEIDSRIREYLLAVGVITT